MSAAVKPALLTPEEYLEIEAKSFEKSEFFQGVMYAMSGSTFAHNDVAASLAAEFRGLLRGSNCRAVGSDQRVYVLATGLFTYPDVVVVCGPPQFAPYPPRETMVNPVLIAEVLSRSTEAYDRGAKFLHYQGIETLREYLLLSQFEPLVEHFSKQSSGKWLQTVHRQGGTIHFPSLDRSLAVASIYEGIQLPAERPHRPRFED